MKSPADTERPATMPTTSTPAAAELEQLADTLAAALLRALNIVVAHSDYLVGNGVDRAAARAAAVERIAVRWPHLAADVTAVLTVIDGLEVAR